MRTTLTIEDSLIKALKEKASQEGKSFKDVVNEVVRVGLHVSSRPHPTSYRLKPMAMGPVRAEHNLAKARQISDELEDQALGEKLEQRR